MTWGGASLEIVFSASAAAANMAACWISGDWEGESSSAPESTRTRGRFRFEDSAMGSSSSSSWVEGPSLSESSVMQSI